MSHNLPVQLGLCCMNTTLKREKPPVYCSRRIIVRTVRKLGIDELKKRILKNLEDLLVMIQWNEDNGIKVFRLSSELFLHKTNPRVEDYTYDFAIPLLKRIGALARKYNQRLTFHPGQYNVLATTNCNAFLHTIEDLTYHAEVLDLMGMGRDSVMVIHGGGRYGDKKSTIERWITNYRVLPTIIRNRLVLENCERNFSIKDCLYISSECGVPIVMDTHHFNCYCRIYPDEHFDPPESYIEPILKTWGKIRPKFHVSEQGNGRIGKHSDYIEIIPEYLLNIPKLYGVHIDIMVEAKMKELSIQKLYERYPQLNCINALHTSSEHDKDSQVIQKLSNKD